MPGPKRLKSGPRRSIHRCLPRGQNRVLRLRRRLPRRRQVPENHGSHIPGPDTRRSTGLCSGFKHPAHLHAHAAEPIGELLVDSWESFRGKALKRVDFLLRMSGHPLIDREERHLTSGMRRSRLELMRTLPPVHTAFLVEFTALRLGYI